MTKRHRARWKSNCRDSEATVHHGEGIAGIAETPCAMEKELQRLLSDYARWTSNCRDIEATVHDGEGIEEIANRPCTMEKELRQLKYDLI
jgi:hypothetical protein